MSKLEKIDASKFVGNFEGSELSELGKIIGGAADPCISKKTDCNASNNDSDDTKWSNDSSSESDTVRADDGCNEKL
jgi:hypothetical protein